MQKPSQEFIDHQIKGHWRIPLVNVFRQIAQRDEAVGDLERLVAALPDEALLVILKSSKSYTEIVTSERDDANLIRVVRQATWPAAA